MTKLRTRHMALILSVAALAAAGCGSSSKSKSTPAAPVTPSTPSTGTGTSTTPAKGGFSAQMNALCTQGSQAVKGVTSAPKVATIAEGFLPKFQALKPPAAKQAAYTQYISIFKAEIAAAKKNDLTALKTLETQAKGLGSKLGAPAC